MQRPGLSVSILVPKGSVRKYSIVNKPGTMCSRRRFGTEQEKQVRIEESEGAKMVEGPVQAEEAVVAASESDGAAVASS